MTTREVTFSIELPSQGVDTLPYQACGQPLVPLHNHMSWADHVR